MESKAGVFEVSLLLMKKGGIQQRFPVEDLPVGSGERDTLLGLSLQPTVHGKLHPVELLVVKRPPCLSETPEIF